LGKELGMYMNQTQSGGDACLFPCETSQRISQLAL
jgi:hypothetical protein